MLNLHTSSLFLTFAFTFRQRNDPLESKRIINTGYHDNDHQAAPPADRL